MAECHLVVRLELIGGRVYGPAATTPRLNVVAADPADDWFTFADTVLDIALEYHSIRLSEPEGLVTALQSIAHLKERREDRVVHRTPVRPPDIRYKTGG